MEERTGAGGAYDAVTSDTGPWAVVPEWLLDADVSDRAVRLYAVLARYADNSTREAYPNKRTLRRRLRCSDDSVSRARAELVDAGALIVTPRYEESEDGAGRRQTSNHYVVLRVPPRTAAEGAPRSTAGVSPRTAAGARTRTTKELEPVELETHGADIALVRLPGPRTADKKLVTDAELALAWDVLREWNRTAGQDLRAHDWLTKIILRCREYPEATLVDHTLIIETALKHPWWKGPATPSVVYGNGAQFERSVQAVRAHMGENDDERLARIVNEAVEKGRKTA